MKPRPYLLMVMLICLAFMAGCSGVRFGGGQYQGLVDQKAALDLFLAIPSTMEEKIVMLDECVQKWDAAVKEDTFFGKTKTNATYHKLLIERLNFSKEQLARARDGRLNEEEVKAKLILQQTWLQQAIDAHNAKAASSARVEELEDRIAPVYRAGPVLLPV